MCVCKYINKQIITNYLPDKYFTMQNVSLMQDETIFYANARLFTRDTCFKHWWNM